MNFFRVFFCYLVLLFFSAVAVGEDFLFNVGVDAQWRSMPFLVGFGDNIVRKHYPQGAVYGGMKFNDFFGLELGYQRSVVEDRKELIDTDGTSYFGSAFNIIDLGDYYITRSKVSSEGFYTGFLGFLPISEEYRLKLIASVGIVRMKTKILSDVDFYDSAGITSINALQLSFIQTKWIPKLSAGIQHMMSDHCGVRALATWEQTDRFCRIMGLKPEKESSEHFAKLKNSITLGLGFFYNFNF